MICKTYQTFQQKIKKNILNLTAANYFKNVLNVSQCVASTLLLTTVCKCLGTEETGSWTIGRGMLSHSSNTGF